MFEEQEAEEQEIQEDISGIVKLAPIALALPLAIPFALPLALHAIHGIGVGGIGILAASLALHPKSQELLKSSGELLSKMLPVDTIDPPE
ncbi:hypothetical protein [Chlorobium ferrooxidans]|uniref:Uncharacterized protein n=1 Tax=Chlorobium ferrooxidans DSM 13031 TaxID=377431 RepID=Q0YV06_9CHLB|nr:hypothetical protein [Chlorobium ferrooxidans]EAT59886.1 hypothetical protein CferDRAFT_1893 [Chlorobium ferrooxidans DSM 13031]